MHQEGSEGVPRGGGEPQGMTQHEASRTLVKSPPELWAECSDAASLARHLGQFGEIRITRLEPETAVAWEGEQISGTVRLEPTGWGTKVILTARRQDADGPSPEPVAAEDLEPETEPEPETETEPEAGLPKSLPSQAAPTPQPAPAADDTRVEREPVEAPLGVQRSSKQGAIAWLREFFGFAPASKQLVLEPLPAPPAAPADEDETELLPPPVTESARVAVTMASPDPVEGLRARTEDTMATAEKSVPPADEAVPPADAVGQAGDETEQAADEALSAALDSLGQAHHRPFSRG